MLRLRPGSLPYGSSECECGVLPAPSPFSTCSQGDPSLRHVKQRNLAPAIRKPLSNFEAMGGVQPVARYDFAGRHPHPDDASGFGSEVIIALQSKINLLRHCCLDARQLVRHKPQRRRPRLFNRPIREADITDLCR
jgi:hypothetical protein